MNIPDDEIAQYPDDNATIIDDPRVFRGVLIAAETWGSLTLSEPGSGSTEYIDEIIAEFADKAADLRAKYEVTGDILNGESAIENDYYEKLSTLLTKYRYVNL